MVCCLSNSGVGVNKRYNLGKAPLCVVVIHKHSRTIDLLAKYGTEVNENGYHGKGLLSDSAESKKYNVIQMPVKYSTEV